MNKSDGWYEGRLGDFLTLQRGYDLPEYDRKQGGVPVVTSSGVSGSHDVARAEGPGVVMGRYGTIGQIYYIERDFWPHNTTLFVTDFKGNYPHYIYYFLQTLNYSAHNDKTSVPGVNRNHLYTLPVSLPPLAEQREIAGILGALDDKIALNRQMNTTLEGMARALFQSWFVDFDPVRAKTEGRAPDGIDEATAALFPDSFEESALGSVPRGWRVGTLGEVAEVNSWTLSKRDLLDQIEYIEISAVNRGEISEIALYERGGEPSRARRRLRHGDTVMSTVRPDRQAYFLSLYPSEALIASTGFAVVTPQMDEWSFVHAALIRQDVFDRLGHLADGAAYPAVDPEVLLKTEVAYPTENALLEQFHAQCAPLYERMDAHRRESRTLAALRDALLPKLVSGDVRVGGRHIG